MPESGKRRNPASKGVGYLPESGKGPGVGYLPESGKGVGYLPESCQGGTPVLPRILQGGYGTAKNLARWEGPTPKVSVQPFPDIRIHQRAPSTASALPLTEPSTSTRNAIAQQAHSCSHSLTSRPPLACCGSTDTRQPLAGAFWNNSTADGRLWLFSHSNQSAISAV